MVTDGNIFVLVSFIGKAIAVMGVEWNSNIVVLVSSDDNGFTDLRMDGAKAAVGTRGVRKTDIRVSRAGEQMLFVQGGANNGARVERGFWELDGLISPDRGWMSGDPAVVCVERWNARASMQVRMAIHRRDLRSREVI